MEDMGWFGRFRCGRPRSPASNQTKLREEKSMRETKKRDESMQTLCVNRTELPKLLGCGQATADRLSVDAGARIKIGKRVLVKLDKLNSYLEKIAK